jgi:hypothetical protein
VYPTLIQIRVIRVNPRQETFRRVATVMEPLEPRPMRVIRVNPRQEILSRLATTIERLEHRADLRYTHFHNI